MDGIEAGRQSCYYLKCVGMVELSEVLYQGRSSRTVLEVVKQVMKCGKLQYQARGARFRY
jgi:hypothetical protein